MAVDNGVKKAFYDNSEDDDDGPIVFKRNNIASKKGQLSSTPTKPSSSQKHVEPSGRRISDQSAANRLNSVSQKSKVASTTKVSHVEPSGRRISDQSDANGLNSVSQKSKVALTPKVSAGKCNTVSSISQPKHFTEHRLATNGVERVLNKFSHEDEESDDSDDDIPLSVRLSADSAAVQSNNSSHAQKLVKHSSKHSLVSNGTGKMTLCKSDGQSGNSDDGKPLNPKFSTASVSVQKSNSLHATEVLRSPMPASSASPNMKANIKNYSDDSEDEKPLASRFSLKPGVGTLAKKLPDSDEEKPLASRHEQNGSTKRDSNSELKPSKGLSKRPLGDISSSTNSSIKKAKVSDVSVTVKVKHEPVVKEEDIDDDDHMPISLRMKKSVSSANQSSAKKVMKKINSSSFKKETKTKKAMKKSKFSKSMTVPPGSGGGQKWTTLQHNGVIFPPPYKPHGVKILYNGQPVDLTHEQEEVATMFAVMKDTDYATKEKFIDNFMNDWRQILGRNHVIKKFELCDFTPIYEWHLREKEKKKQMSTEEKKALKEEKLKQEEKYMWATVDGIKEKVGNFRVEPPGLFRGRGEHPKMGKLKRRIRPKDITINIGKDAPIPECPIPGERWKEVKHDNSVTWLAFWNDPINPKDFKYVFLAASSSLKGQSDKEKYEKARLLKDYIHGIRANYTKDFSSKDATKRQIAVATYLIDKLALRAGNEKDDDEADTVGCCTLKVENVALIPPNKLQFDFLGKDSIRYFNIVEVELPVYKAIGEFRNGGGKRKADGDDLFDMLDTSKLNAHLKELMPGLTAKVFRTYNASITLDDMLNIETKDGTLPEKVAVYQHANKEVAIICNHQRSVSKSHDAQMSRLNDKIDELKAQQEELKVDLSRSRKGKPPLKDAEGKSRNFSPEVLEKKLAQIDARMEKMELDKKIKEDLKTVALGTSKINYLDPRISVAWCKRHEVPIEKIFNKSLLAKFAWAMDVDPSFRF